jgi:hypothetical protein
MCFYEKVIKVKAVQVVFRRLLPRLGYQSACWAIAHRLCCVVWKILHERARFIEKGSEPDAQTKKKRARMLVQAPAGSATTSQSPQHI